MDPTTPSPEKPPPSPPQNPHTPPDALFEGGYVQKGDPSTRQSFKALMVNLAGRLLPAHQSLIEQRSDDILPDDLLVPDHPPYADMILTALWELKAEGGSSEDDISHFIRKEYHELPWAHATILNHHLRDLCEKGKIAMTRDKRYIRCSSITQPEPSPSASPSPSPSPPSSDYSFSLTSSSNSPSSSSSSQSWAGPYRTRKKKKVKRRRRKKVKVKGRGRGKGRGGPPMMVRARLRRSCRDRFDMEQRNKVEESEEETEGENEVTSMEVEDHSTKDGDLPDEIGKTGEEEDLPCEQNNTEIGEEARKLEEAESDALDVQCNDEVIILEDDVTDAKEDDNVEQTEQKEERGARDTEIGQEAQKLEEAEVDTLDVPCNDEVVVLEDDDSDAKEDINIEQAEHKEEKGATYMELEASQQEENQQSDSVEIQTLGEPVIDDKNRSEERDPVMMQCEARVAVAGVEKKHDETFEEQIQPEENKEAFQTHEQEKTESNRHLDRLTEEKVETKEQSANLRDDDNDVTEQPTHPQEQRVEKIDESPQPAEQDQLQNIEAASAEQEEQQTEVNQNEIVLAEVQQEQSVEMSEQKNQPCIQQTLQEKNNPVRNEENTTSSGSTTDGSTQPSRPGLRSSSKKEDSAPNSKSKKQLDLVTPVRRSLRSNKTISEAAVITEVPDHSKDQETHSGRTRSSKRKSGTAEAEQVSNTRKTRRTGL